MNAGGDGDGDRDVGGGVMGHGRGLTVRKRIALIYGGAFVVLGAVLLAFVNLLSRAGTEAKAADIAVRVQPMPITPTGTVPGAPARGPRELDPFTAYQLTDNVSHAANEQLVLWSGVALLVTALLAVGVGWWTAGRVLRPVYVMTEKARGIGERNLHERIAQGGPRDELKELADTIDALLGRLQGAFESQRRFIANASHELRTPLATQRTAIQVGLDEEATPQELARTKAALLESNRRSELLIEGLLTLARGERGLERRDPVDLTGVVAEEVGAHRARAKRARVTLVVDAKETTTRGDRVLLSQLVGNLVRNAIDYNVPHGSVEVLVAPGGLTVSNTGPRVEPDEVASLFEPFRRGEGRDRQGPGAGLGLSIVRSIAVAHGGSATAVPGPKGGLAVTVELPRSSED